MSSYPFLSEEWISAAVTLRDEYAQRIPPAPTGVRANLVITRVPHGGADEVAASLDTAATGLLPQLGHIAEPELTVTMEYEVARSLFVDQNIEAVTQAFMGGKISIEGDMTRLFALTGEKPAEADRALAKEVSDRLLAMTD